MNIVEPIRSRKDVARIEKFLEGNSKRNRLIFVFGINTGLRVSDILVKFSRNRTYDLVSRTVSMSNMINMGIDPEKAITVVDIFDDSHQVALDSRERIDEILMNKNKDMNTESSSPTVDGAEDNIKKNDQPSAVPNVDK